MSAAVPAISIEGLSKAYRIGHQQQKSETIGEALVGALTAPLKRFASLGRRSSFSSITRR